MCQGEIVTWLGADDYFAEDTTLEKVAKYFEDPEVQIISGRCNLINIDTGEAFLIPQPEVTEESLIRWWNKYAVPPQPAIFFQW